ncbi:MAG TPA: pyridoxamine 5'-phosphate oxidase family protein, partial [Acidimicrobiia bacterium]|nr:pyridoxamine 5'-phosphate oxidase family protein [Acidimicrobiia bacterium]
MSAHGRKIAALVKRGDDLEALIDRAPAGHADLLDRPLPAALTTEMPDGWFQSTVVWFNRDGDHIVLNTMREFQKARNLRARPRDTLLVLEPEEDQRWIELRPRSCSRTRGLSSTSTSSLDSTWAPPGTSAAVPAELAAVEHPVRVRLIPTAVATRPKLFLCDRRTSNPAPEWWNRLRPCEDEPPILDGHRDLLERPIVAVFTCRLPSGAAQTQPVWCEPDGNDILINTTRERRRGRNLELDPKATILIIDPQSSVRWIEIRA